MILFTGTGETYGHGCKFTEVCGFSITDKCSTDTYFRYDYTDADHITHVIVIGGTADDYGYAEYLFDADGTYIFNNMNVSSDTPAWFVNAEKDLGVDAESLSDEAATYSVTEE